MRIVWSGQSNTLIALLNKQRGGKIRMAMPTRCVEALLLRRMAPVTATPALSVISVFTRLNSLWLHLVATSSVCHACSSGSIHSHPLSECPASKGEVLGSECHSDIWKRCWRREFHHQHWLATQVASKQKGEPEATTTNGGHNHTRRQLIQNQGVVTSLPILHY